jgi:arsenite-transporting ATPase
MKVVRPLLRNITNMPLPDDKLFDIVKGLVGDLSRMHDLLSDPEQSTVRLVFNPDKMVIKEAQRTLTYVTLYGFITDAAICNRIIPDEVRDPYFDAWKRAQSENMELVQEAFSPLPIYRVPMFSQELVGIDMLRKMADCAFGDTNPAAVLHQDRVYQLTKEAGVYRLSLNLPLAARGDIDLIRKRDELIVMVGSRKRNVLLPGVLAHLTVQGAKYEGKSLVVTFSDEKAA